MYDTLQDILLKAREPCLAAVNKNKTTENQNKKAQTIEELKKRIGRIDPDASVCQKFCVRDLVVHSPDDLADQLES